MPGGDVNPYLAIAGLVAGGLHGIEQELELERRVHRQRLRRRRPPSGCRRTLRDALELGRTPRVAEDAFGDEVVAHYANIAQVELAAFDAAVTDWELFRASNGSSRRRGRGARRTSVRTRRPREVRARSGRPASRRRAGVARPTRRSRGPRAASSPGGGVAPGDRARLLRRFAAVVDDHLEELAQLEVRNAGHTIGNARWEAGNVRDVLDYYAGAPERLTGRQIPVPGGLDVTFHEPLGVVGVIVPWNFPMPIAGWGFAPALAAGNTVVLKPAELTPLTALRLAELALEAGLPEGVFNVLPGQGTVVGERFVAHPAVRKICFTGSTEVGKRIMAGCADQVKRVTLELGGKSANIVFADADLEKAAATAPYAVFDNAGQDCCARSRILVQRRVYDRFLELLEPAVRGVAGRRPGRRDAPRWAR